MQPSTQAINMESYNLEPVIKLHYIVSNAVGALLGNNYNDIPVGSCVRFIGVGTRRGGGSGGACPHNLQLVGAICLHNQSHPVCAILGLAMIHH